MSYTALEIDQMRSAVTNLIRQERFLESGWYGEYNAADTERRLLTYMSQDVTPSELAHRLAEVMQEGEEAQKRREAQRVAEREAERVANPPKPTRGERFRKWVDAE